MWMLIKVNYKLMGVMPPNNFFLNSYSENLTIELHDLYVLNVHTNFHSNQVLFTIWSINSSSMYYFKLQKFEFKQLIDDTTINF